MEKLYFENIEVGDDLPPVEKTMTQEIINRWAEIAQDYNLLHVDPEYAKTTRFGGTIAHGYISVCYLNEMMTNWLGDGWLRGGKLVDIQFKAPVRSGDKVTSKGKVAAKRMEGNQKLVECEVYLENQDGAKPVVGRAIGTLPN